MVRSGDYYLFETDSEEEEEEEEKKDEEPPKKSAFQVDCCVFVFPDVLFVSWLLTQLTSHHRLTAPTNPSPSFFSPRLQRAIGKFVSAVLALPKSVIRLPKTVLQYVVKAGKVLTGLTQTLCDCQTAPITNY